MQLTYRLATNVDSEKFLPSLTLAAGLLGVELKESSEFPADLFFFKASEPRFSKTGLKVGVGDGWTPELLAERGVQLRLPDQLLAPVAAQILLAWIVERQTLRKVSPLRHELGNFVMILMGRILRMKQGDSEEHLKSLETLHERMLALYQEFDTLELPRYDTK